ncbi:cobalt-zinc-cadmium resistance protein [Cupriavidus cauae]|uniref:Cobalt-zinc-cadmium resistance protein n=2 Tax=Cupriavidus cauae TaxID=2608999 RepID=A0A5M8B717_9BURK|nr:cobalt-zinc-cadmium resistance protein [Cupriavidus sp. DB3]KAA0178952.1 cobalt-zinc-cadmium resistance protein [Cupriavidus gilardii]KAA6129710.1 cobalt-zinc-cadmium resistance protein [Cupriavidus cauae]MCA7082089.1 cobalt-zinc-cadmium resistance protein [Cupriavidus sp. DB3]UZN51911.1 cobalt-zinc-cadmium resistance protein [Cupriavidus cauae]
MRALLPFLIACCLFLLSFGAQAGTRLDAAAGLGPGQMRVGPLVCSMAAVAAVAARTLSSDEDGSRIVAPGDDGIHADDVVESAPSPGYCNIWSADLLDPPDVLDEIEESSALFALPTAPLELPSGDVSPPRHGRAPPLPAALFKPPILTA